MGTEGGDKCVDNVDKLRKKWWGGEKGTNPEEVWLLRGGGVVEADSGWKEKHKKKITGYGAGERIRGVFTYKNGNRTC